VTAFSSFKCLWLQAQGIFTSSEPLTLFGKLPLREISPTGKQLKFPEPYEIPCWHQQGSITMGNEDAHQSGLSGYCKSGSEW